MGEILADLQKVERLAVVEVGHGGGQAGAVAHVCSHLGRTLRT